MTLQQLRIFVLLHRYGTLAQVAKIMGLTQSTVSFHLQSLGDSAEVDLFVPNSKHFALTEAGNALLTYARKIVDLTDEVSTIMKDFHYLRKEKLVIGASHIPATYFLPGIIKSLQSVYPEAQLSIICDKAPKIIEGIMDRDIHLGLVLDLEDRHQADRLKVHTIANDELGIVATKDAKIQWKRWPISPEDLADIPMIIHNTGASARIAAETWLMKHHLTPLVRLELGSTEAIKKAVQERLGIAILSKLAVSDEVKRGELIYIPMEDPPARSLQLIHLQNVLMTDLMRAFMEHSFQFGAQV